MIIPIEVREKLNLRPNDTVLFEERDSEIVVRKAADIMHWYGAVKYDGPIDARSLREAAEQAWVEDALKGT